MRNNYNVITMETEIIKIGNSKGIRIPKAILEQCGLSGVVEMSINGDKIIISKPARKPREGWAEAIEADIKKHGAPEMLWSDGIVNEFDKTEWTWPDQPH